MKPRSSFRYSEENILAYWHYPLSREAVDQEVGRRSARCETGERHLRNFTFEVRADYRPVLRAAGFELEFSRLAWARFAKWFGISRDFVRLRLKGGGVGRATLETSVNELLKSERHAKATFMLFRHQDDEHHYTIRDLLRTDIDPEVDVPDLWAYLRDEPKLWHGQSQLTLFRLSDYAHQFRHIVGKELVKGSQVGVIVDACLSFARKLYYAQGGYYWLEGDQVVMARVDTKELGAKEIFVEPSFISEAAEEVVDAMMDGLPTFREWARDAAGKFDGDDELTTFARVVKVLRNRRLPVPHRTDVYQRLVARAGAKQLDTQHAIMDVSAAANSSDHPEMGNRLERAVYDLRTGKNAEPSKADRVTAEKLLRVDDLPRRGKEVQLSSLSSGSGSA